MIVRISPDGWGHDRENRGVMIVRNDKLEPPGTRSELDNFCLSLTPSESSAVGLCGRLIDSVIVSSVMN